MSAVSSPFQRQAICERPTNLGARNKLGDERPRGLLQAVEHEGERAGGVAQVEELLQEEQAVRAGVDA